MLAYLNDPALKTQFVELLKAHQVADQIIQRSYWSDGRGCAVGCSIDSLRTITKQSLDRADHALYESLIGVPQILAKLEDGIFEGLPIARAVRWPIEFAESIRPGADLALVWPRFAVWLLADPSDGVLRFAKTDKQHAAIQQVADLYSRQLEGVDVPIGEWKAAAAAAYAAAADDAAYDAAYDAADAAAYAAAAAADAAYDAAYDAADAAAYAAAAAAYDAAADAAAKQQSRIRQADRLLALLRAA